MQSLSLLGLRVMHILPGPTLKPRADPADALVASFANVLASQHRLVSDPSRLSVQHGRRRARWLPDGRGGLRGRGGLPHGQPREGVGLGAGDAASARPDAVSDG